MTAVQAAGSSDPSGLEHGDRSGESLDTRQMGAVGADPRHDLGPAVDQERDVAALNCRRHRFGPVDQPALVAVGEAQQHRGNVRGVERRLDLADECRRVVKARRDKVEPLARALRPWPSFSGKWGRIAFDFPFLAGGAGSFDVSSPAGGGGYAFDFSSPAGGGG